MYTYTFLFFLLFLLFYFFFFKKFSTSHFILVYCWRKRKHYLLGTTGQFYEFFKDMFLTYELAILPQPLPLYFSMILDVPTYESIRNYRFQVTFQ